MYMFGGAQMHGKMRRRRRRGRSADEKDETLSSNTKRNVFDKMIHKKVKIRRSRCWNLHIFSMICCCCGLLLAVVVVASPLFLHSSACVGTFNIFIYYDFIIYGICIEWIFAGNSGKLWKTL